MALSDYTPEKATVPFPGGSFEVRGLTVSDLTVLCQVHMPEMQWLTKAIAGRLGDDLSPDTALAFGLEMIQEAPFLVANIIAHAADELDAVPAALKLPVGPQLAALEQIGRMTFVDVAGLKNSFGAIRNLAIRLLPPAELVAPQGGSSRSKRGTGRSEAA